MRIPDKINGNVAFFDDTHEYVDRDTNEKFILQALKLAITYKYGYTKDYAKGFLDELEKTNKLFSMKIFHYTYFFRLF